MKTPPAAPYLLPAPEAIECEPWTTSDGADLPRLFEHWDPFTDLELFRLVRINADALRAACNVGPDASFAVIASWYATRTRLAGPATALDIGVLSGIVEVPLSLTVPGTSAGGRLELKTQVVLRTPGRTVSPISPQREGAVLWRDTESVALEGAAARFPVTAVDFASLPRIPDRAAWALEWNSEELDHPVLGALRLLVNASNAELIAAVRSGSTDPRANAIRAFVMFDVARAMVGGALSNERFTSEPESFEEGSLGRMLFNLITSTWPGVPIRTLQDRKITDPARFEAELQASVGVLA